MYLNEYMHIQCIDSMSSPRKRRSRSKKKEPDTLEEAFEGLSLNEDDAWQEETKSPRSLEVAQREERFTVVLDDVSEDEKDSLRKMIHPYYRLYPVRLENAILRQFPNAQIVPLTRFERMLAQSDAVHHLDVRTVFVALEWDAMANYANRYLPMQHSRMAVAMNKYATIMNVPLPNFFPGARSGEVLLVVLFTQDPKLEQQLTEVARDRPWQGISDGFTYFYTEDDLRHERSVDVRVYPFFAFADHEKSERQDYINQCTVRALLRYFYDDAFYYGLKDEANRKEVISANNSARALQEIISQGLAESFPSQFPLPPQPRRYPDEIRLREAEIRQNAHDATVGFVRRDDLYDPRLFLLIWKFVFPE